MEPIKWYLIGAKHIAKQLFSTMSFRVLDLDHALLFCATFQPLNALLKTRIPNLELCENA